uniref:Uncharacterized protein n=1 Tax=Glossina pallidipes TaxID=7398 RepID=A0A1B0A7Q9_GLOPL
MFFIGNCNWFNFKLEIQYHTLVKSYKHCYKKRERDTSPQINSENKWAPACNCLLQKLNNSSNYDNSKENVFLIRFRQPSMNLP